MTTTKTETIVGQLAIDFSDAFIRKDLDFISTEHFTDSIFFYPEKGSRQNGHGFRNR